MTDVPDRRRLWRQFVIGVFWIAAWAGLIAFVTQTSFWIVMPGMVGIALGGGAIGLFWMARWAERDNPSGQFGIASLFLLIVYIAAFLSCVRWSLSATHEVRLQRFPTAELSTGLEPTLLEFAMTSLVGLALLWASLPILLGLLDSAMWSVVWFLKRPWVKAFAVKMLHNSRRD
jgi:hypothetical protein